MQFSGESGEWEPRVPYQSWPAATTGLQASRGPLGTVLDSVDVHVFPGLRRPALGRIPWPA